MSARPPALALTSHRRAHFALAPTPLSPAHQRARNNADGVTIATAPSLPLPLPSPSPRPRPYTGALETATGDDATNRATVTALSPPCLHPALAHTVACSKQRQWRDERRRPRPLALAFTSPSPGRCQARNSDVATSSSSSSRHYRRPALARTPSRSQQ